MPPRSPSGAHAGFTLVEVLIAVAVLAGALTGAAMLLTSAFGTYRHQGQTMEVFHVVHDEVETLTATPYQELHNHIETARHPDDPTRPDMAPDQDFATGPDGAVRSRFELEPQGPTDPTYHLKPKPAGQRSITSADRQKGTLDGTITLQYWDPVFDGPAPSDRGLIRATIAITGDGLNDHAVKYFAR